MRVAYQGEPGAYSEAALLRFNPAADPLPRETFDEVFRAVQEREATHGVLPIENSIGGTIHRNYDLLLEHELPELLANLAVALFTELRSAGAKGFVCKIGAQIIKEAIDLAGTSELYDAGSLLLGAD